MGTTEEGGIEKIVGGDTTQVLPKGTLDTTPPLSIQSGGTSYVSPDGQPSGLPQGEYPPSSQNVVGIVRPIDELDSQIYELGAYKDPLNPRDGGQLAADIMATLIFEGIYDPNRAIGNSHSFHRERRNSEQPHSHQEGRRKSDYHFKFHESLKTLMKQPDVPLSELAVPFISGEVNEKTALAFLFSVSDQLKEYQHIRSSNEAPEGYIFPQFRTLQKMIGLVRLYAKKAYEGFKQADDRKHIDQYFTSR